MSTFALTPAQRPRVTVVGAPSDLGANLRGAVMGPAALRTAGIVARLDAAGLAVVDAGDVVVSPVRGDVAPHPKKRHIEAIAAAGEGVFLLARDALQTGRLPVVLGGDHSISAGSAAATATHVREQSGRGIGVLWLDAHGDMNTPDTTLTGNVHGMALAALVGAEPEELARLGGWTHKVAPKHVVLLGVRSLDPAEREAIAAMGMHLFTAADVRRRGVADVMQEVRAVFADTDGVHVSLDIDVCDPGDAPGVSTPEPDGLPLPEVRALLRMAATLDVRSLDLVEVNPARDLRNTTAELGVELALSVLCREGAA